MISHQHRCIFIHIPKCAGTSIESVLGHVGRQDHRTIRMIERPSLNTLKSGENIYEFLRRVRNRYRPSINLRNKNSVTRDQYESYFKFTFVRNPWARAYSWYKNVMRDANHRHNLNIKYDMDFNVFLDTYCGRGLARPQTHWIKNFAGSISLDHIGKFENLQDDFNICCEKMNIEPIRLPHKLKSFNDSYLDAYNKSTIKLISEVYREEIELFGYSFSK